MRKGKVYVDNTLAGYIIEDEEGYHFFYDSDYRSTKMARMVSRTLPLTEKKITSQTLHPFFDGLIPEGWLLDVAKKNWKIDPRDRMALLLTLCRDCIGNVSIQEDGSL